RDGFLSGWNLGNVFTVHSALCRKPDWDLPSLPADVLRAVWEWNYYRPERSDKFENSAAVPAIMFLHIDGRPSRVVVWVRGMPVLRPGVDYVLVGRMVSDEPRFGLAPWSDVVDVVQRARFDTTKDPIGLHYFITRRPSPNGSPTSL